MSGGAAEQRSRTARCVVWHPRGAPTPPDLEAALHRPGFKLVRCENDFAALALICHATSADSTILLLVEPQRLDDVSQVVLMAQKYAPKAIVWVFDPAASPRLRSMNAADTAAWASAGVGIPQVIEDAVSSTRVKLGGPPKLRLAGEGPATEMSPVTVPESKVNPVPDPLQEAPPVPNGGTGSIGHLLSDEELAMLLAPDPDKGHY